MKAIVLCAGQGMRCRPATLACPKALLPVRGKPLLEHALQLLHEHGVKDITLVVGYLADHFSFLQQTYGVTLRFNPGYAAKNNHSSLYVAADLLDDTLVIDGDLFFVRDWFPALKAGVSQFVTQPTLRGLEWKLVLDDEARVRKVEKWQKDGYGMVGVSYWTGEASRLLARELTQCGPDDYWEDAALRILDKTPVYAACVEDTFVQEIDTLADALEFGLMTDQAIAELCSPGFAPIKLKGLTNDTWHVRDAAGGRRVLRIPGRGTARFLDRAAEPAVLAHLEGLGVTPPTSFFAAGFKLTDFLPHHRDSRGSDLTEPYFQRLAKILRQLHSIPHSPEVGVAPLTIGTEIRRYEQIARQAFPEAFRLILDSWAAEFDAEPAVLCHRDLLLENILVEDADGRGMQLIDFEYTGFTHPFWDAASFILESGLQGSLRESFLRAFLGRAASQAELDRMARMEILVDYVWGLWGLVNGYEDYARNRLTRSMNRLRAANLVPCVPAAPTAPAVPSEF